MMGIVLEAGTILLAIPLVLAKVHGKRWLTSHRESVRTYEATRYHPTHLRQRGSVEALNVEALLKFTAAAGTAAEHMAGMAKLLEALGASARKAHEARERASV